MGRTDKEWRLPAGRNYHGKITMIEVRTLVQEFNKEVEKPETIVENSGEFAYTVSSKDLMEGKVMNIKVNDGGKEEVEANKENKKTKKINVEGNEK